MCSRCLQNLNYAHFTSSCGSSPKKNCTNKCAARAAWLFFLVQPIKSLICGVVVAVAVVKSYLHISYIEAVINQHNCEMSLRSAER